MTANEMLKKPTIRLCRMKLINATKVKFILRLISSTVSKWPLFNALTILQARTSLGKLNIGSSFLNKSKRLTTNTVEICFNHVRGLISYHTYSLI